MCPELPLLTKQEVEAWDKQGNTESGAREDAKLYAARVETAYLKWQWVDVHQQ